MEKETRTVVFDSDLNIEAYRFENIIQSFPNHFHDYYVIGFIEKGERTLFCKNSEHSVKQDDILIFNPADNHGCVQIDNGTFNYNCMNISKQTMQMLTEEITGKKYLPEFSQPVVSDKELLLLIRKLHRLIMNNGDKFEKEENLFLALCLLIQNYSQSSVPEQFNYSHEIENACDFIHLHYSEHISLEQLCDCCNISKSTLLRAFTKSKGVTPYRYLQSVRVDKAKVLLENGLPPSEAALQAGFSDQSHFTNVFNTYIGLSPAAYRNIFRNNKNDKE